MKRVIDGDTVIVATGAGEEKVRLKGVDAPEIPHPDFGRFKSDPYGPESRRCLIDLLDSHRVRLVSARPSGEPERDEYGRLLAYVYDGDTLVNAELVRQGCARAMRKFPHPRQKEFIELEAKARSGRRGLWARGN